MIKNRKLSVYLQLVKGDGHDSVGGVESFFNAISMMNIYINVQNSSIGSQELQYGQDNVLKV